MTCLMCASASCLQQACVCVCVCVCVCADEEKLAEMSGWLAAQHRDTDRAHTEAVWQRRCKRTHTCACKHTSYSACEHSQSVKQHRSACLPKELKGHSVTHRYSDCFSLARGVRTHTHTQTHAYTHEHTQCSEKLIYINKLQTVV